MPSLGIWKYIKIKLQTVWFHLIKNPSYETKIGLELVSLLHFVNDFWRKIFLLFYIIKLTKFNCLVAFTS